MHIGHHQRTPRCPPKNLLKPGEPIKFLLQMCIPYTVPEQTEAAVSRRISSQRVRAGLQVLLCLSEVDRLKLRYTHVVGRGDPSASRCSTNPLDRVVSSSHARTRQQRVPSTAGLGRRVTDTLAERARTSNDGSTDQHTRGNLTCLGSQTSPSRPAVM